MIIRRLLCQVGATAHRRPVNEGRSGRREPAAAVGAGQNVPVELASFVGRARELAEVRGLLAATRVVTLTGPGRIGKSRLALRAAHRAGRYSPQGGRSA